MEKPHKTLLLLFKNFDLLRIDKRIILNKIKSIIGYNISYPGFL